MKFPEYIKPHVSNSSLAELKRVLRHQPPFSGGEQYLIFGRELHKRFLEPHLPIELLSEQQEEALSAMVDALYMDDLLSSLYNHSDKEVTFIRPYNNVLCKGIIDMKAGDIGIDLKTTSARSEGSFLQSAIKFGYFRQAAMYCEAGGLEQFIIVSIQKKPPYTIYTLDINDHQQEYADGVEELNWLINIAKHTYTHLCINT